MVPRLVLCYYIHRSPIHHLCNYVCGDACFALLKFLFHQMCVFVAGRLSGRFYTDKNRLSALVGRHISKKVKSQANVRVNNLSPCVKEALFMVKVGN